MTIVEKRDELVEYCGNQKCSECVFSGTYKKYIWKNPFERNQCLWFSISPDEDIELAYKILKVEEEMPRKSLEDIAELTKRIDELKKEVDEMEKLKQIKESSSQIGYLRKCLIEEGFSEDDVTKIVVETIKGGLR